MTIGFRCANGRGNPILELLKNLFYSYYRAKVILETSNKN
jgi:hypothetical protein